MSALRSAFVVSLLSFWCVGGSIALADASVTTLEHGDWPLAVAALQSDTHSQGTSVSVCVHDDGSTTCAPCASYALSFDAVGSAAFEVGACDPSTGATRVTLRDRSALFDHEHVVPRPRTVTLQASVVHSFATSGGAAVTGGSTLGCTARVRPYLHDLEHGTDVPLVPDRFRVVVQHAAVAVSEVGDGWMFVSEARIGSSVDYDVVEIASGEVVMSGHTTMECASETDTSGTVRPPIDRSGPWVDARPVGASAPITVEFGNLPTTGSPWIGIAPAGSESARYLTYVYTGAEREGHVELDGVPAGSYEIRAYRDSGYTVIATVPIVVGTRSALGHPVSLHVAPTRSNQTISVEYANMPTDGTAWIAIATPGSSAQTYLTYVYVRDAAGTAQIAGVGAGTYEVRAYAELGESILGTTELIVADSLDPACVSAAPIDRAAGHFDLPADGASVRSVRFSVTPGMHMVIDAHSVSRVELWSVCRSASASLIAHNRQVDMGSGHARIMVGTLQPGVYEIRVHTDAQTDAHVDVTPDHTPMFVEFQAAATAGYTNNMFGYGAHAEMDFRFELGTSDLTSGGIGLEISGENYRCDADYGAHGCGTGMSGALDVNVYSVLLPAFFELGPPRDLSAFRFRMQLSPGLLIAQGRLGGLAFTSVAPAISMIGGFDVDLGPLTFTLRAGARFTSLTDGPIEVLGLGFVGNLGLQMIF